MNTNNNSTQSKADASSATPAVVNGRVYIWPAQDGKFRGAKSRFEAEHGFKAYSAIEFRAEDGRLVHTVGPIPAKWPTLGTVATRATVMLTTGCTYEQAKTANAGPNDGRNLGTARAGQFKLAVEADNLVLTDTISQAVAYMNHDGRVNLVFGPAADPFKLIRRAQRLASDFILEAKVEALRPYCSNKATAILNQSDGREYRAEIPADSDIKAARAAIVLADDGHLDLAELVNVRIEQVGQAEFEAWLNAK